MIHSLQYIFSHKLAQSITRQLYILTWSSSSKTITSSSTDSASEGSGDVVMISSVSLIFPWVVSGMLHARLKRRRRPEMLKDVTRILSMATGSGGRGRTLTEQAEIRGEGLKKKSLLLTYSI